MSKKALLIDGMSIAHRAYYALPYMSNSSGTPTGAVYGFLNIISKVIDEEAPQYIAIAFDVSAPTFRHGLYAAYKGTRKPMEDALRTQIPIIKNVIDAMGIRRIESPGLEADDILGTLSHSLETVMDEVIILSGDRDLLQLASEKIRIAIPKTVQKTTAVYHYHDKDVLEQYKVTPLRFIDLKALMGDASDNIPGVPKVGEKTAAALMEQFGSLDAIYEHIDEVAKPAVKQSLIDNKDLAYLSQKLATIVTDAPLELKAQDLLVKDIYNERSKELFIELELNAYIKRCTQIGRDLAKDQDIGKIFQLNSYEDAISKFEQAARKFQIGLALNCESLMDVARLKLAVSFFETEGKVPATYVYYCDVEEGKVLLELIKSVPQIIGFGLKLCLDMFSTEFLADNNSIIDLELAAYLLEPERGSYKIQDLGTRFLKLFLEDELEFGYNALLPLISYEVIKSRLEDEDMWALFAEIEMPLMFVLYDMEKVGVKVDFDTLSALSKEFGDTADRLTNSVFEAAGETFNINSPKQLGQILFEKLELPKGKKTASGYSTAAEVLENLAPEHKIVQDILEYRHISKLKSTYTDALPNYIDDNGRIHTTFHQTVVATGRLSSSNPNLQNIPIRTTLGGKLRKAFCAQEGYCLVDADYSQIELRVLAHMSGDPVLLKAYENGDDIHKITAAKVLGIDINEVTSAQRSAAKAVNFGIVYGISSFGLAKDLGISRNEADKLIVSYFKTYPKIKEFLDNCVSSSKESGYAVTLFNRRRPIRELKSAKFSERSFGERIAMNSPIQGSAADIMKIATIRAYKALKKAGLKSRLVLQVHDELIVEAPIDEVEIVKGLLADAMEGAADLSVRLLADVNVGDNWYEAK